LVDPVLTSIYNRWMIGAFIRN